MAIFSTIGAWVTIGLGNLGLSLTAAMAIGGAVTNIAIGAALLGAQALVSGAFGPKGPTTSTPQAQATLNQAAGARIRGYGIAKLAGTRAFWDSREGRLDQIVMAHHGEVDAFLQFYIGDWQVATGENGVVTTAPFVNDWGSYAYIMAYPGTATQAADAHMLAGWPDIWSTDHVLRGIAYWRVTFYSPPAEDFQRVFPESYNTTVQCVCRLSKVYDPRNDTAAWSENPSLCILDYLTHPDGMRLTQNDVDLASFAAFADVCDELVPLAAGGVERRYRCWGVYSLTDDPQDVLNKLRATCDGELYLTSEGKIAIRGGKWEAPTVTIGAQDILAHSMEQGNNRFAAFNYLKILYTSPDHDYQTTEATPWEDLADQADRGLLEASLTLDMVPSAAQARRLAKIHTSKSNPAWKGTLVANLSALNALGERTVRLVIPELDIDDAFFVAGFSLRPDLTAVEITVMSISEAAYTWTTAEEGQAAPPPQDTRPDIEFPIPQNVVLTQDSGVVTATVDPAPREGLTLQGQIRAGAGSVWQTMANDTSPEQLSFGPVEPGEYQVRTRWTGPGGVAGAWSSPLAEIEVT